MPATHLVRSVTPGCSSFKGPNNLDGTGVTPMMIDNENMKIDEEDSTITGGYAYVRVWVCVSVRSVSCSVVCSVIIMLWRDV